MFVLRKAGVIIWDCALVVDCYLLLRASVIKQGIFILFPVRYFQISFSENHSYPPCALLNLFANVFVCFCAAPIISVISQCLSASSVITIFLL